MNNIFRQQFLIRKAGIQDACGISECLDAAFAAYRARYTAEAFSDTVLPPESVGNRMMTMTLFVAVSDGRIVGTLGCGAQSGEGHLRGMAVLPEWQGTGVASALLWTAEAVLRMNGCRRATLGTTEPLTRAIEFYRKHGFRASGRIEDFFGMLLYEYEKPL